MPWISEGDSPAYYALPVVAGASSDLCLETAKTSRKYWAQHREQMLAYQNQCGKDHIEYARFFREEAAEAMKYQRGFDFLVKWLEGNPITNYPTDITEQLAPYADRAFECA